MFLYTYAFNSVYIGPQIVGALFEVRVAIKQTSKQADIHPVLILEYTIGFKIDNYYPIIFYFGNIRLQTAKNGRHINVHNFSTLNLSKW